ncbi:MAG: GntR family transcriptional regulator [Pseudomonadota bacterium]|nr:GntR family transcriptional regulator [Pseudomonadota bacterium]
MIAYQSKSAFLYLEVRRALRSGSYVPGQRIDPATLAEEFHASATPVRFALYRLVGEGLIADHGRSGLHVPLPTEVVLRDQYDWMRRLLLMACAIFFDAPRPAAGQMTDMSPVDDLAGATWQLFDAIARATDHRSLHRAVEHANDRLAPVRRIGLGLVDDAVDELSMLIRHWQQRDEQALLVGLNAYHERRAQLVPHIVASLGEGGAFLH